MLGVVDGAAWPRPATGATLSKLETSHSPLLLANDTFQRKCRTTAALLSVLVIVASTATIASAESLSMLSTATPRTLASPLFCFLSFSALNTALVTWTNCLSYAGVSRPLSRFW